MAIVETWRALEDIATGETHTYDATGDGSDGYVSVIGCAGAEAFEWDVDEMAEVVEVQVQPSVEDPTLRTYTFVAHFAPVHGEGASPQGPSTLMGRFDAP